MIVAKTLRTACGNVRQASIGEFIGFASNQGYLKGIGHRTAALEDSRLLPLSPMAMGRNFG